MWMCSGNFLPLAPAKLLQMGNGMRFSNRWLKFTSDDNPDEICWLQIYVIAYAFCDLCGRLCCAESRTSAETDEIIIFNNDSELSRAHGNGLSKDEGERRGINEKHLAPDTFLLSNVRLCRFDFSDFLRCFLFSLVLCALRQRCRLRNVFFVKEKQTFKIDNNFPAFHH